MVRGSAGLPGAGDGGGALACPLWHGEVFQFSARAGLPRRQPRQGLGTVPASGLCGSARRSLGRRDGGDIRPGCPRASCRAQQIAGAAAAPLRDVVVEVNRPHLKLCAYHSSRHQFGDCDAHLVSAGEDASAAHELCTAARIPRERGPVSDDERASCELLPVNQDVAVELEPIVLFAPARSRCVSVASARSHCEISAVSGKVPARTHTRMMSVVIS